MCSLLWNDTSLFVIFMAYIKSRSKQESTDFPTDNIIIH